MNNINLGLLLPQMIRGMGGTLSVFGLTALLALPLGLLAAAGRMSKLRVISYPVRAYLLIMRGTPLMLQLFFFYFGPYYIFGIRGANRFVMCIVAFVLNYAAYFAEIYRGGLSSIPEGQYEAAAALGFTKRQTFFKIILPQVIKRITPPMGSEFMSLVKDTSLARVIAVFELFEVARTAADGAGSVVPFIVAGVFYLIMNTVVENAFRLAEKKLGYYR
ncbi:MAG: amino acid ABC transporter permease [Oscillospiraceae bacterium]|jgi:polar amino acid transport system permease protein|nr:amino acid ABC transporter permease [Oscillospiraceae bacterium]